MQQTARTSLQSIASGFMIVAVAAAILLAWLIGSWWMFIPIILMEVGGFYTALGLVARRGEGPAPKGPSSSSYYVFWGPTLVILGLIWILRTETDVDGVILFVVFLLWIGAIAIALSLAGRKPVPKA